MSDESHAVFRLLKKDPRYKLEAYQFVREALSFGQNMLGLGEIRPSEEDASVETPEPEAEPEAKPETAPEAEPELEDVESLESEDWEPPAERHLTGQELCEAIREFAIDQYGLMAKIVLNSWGIHGTGDFGELVYNLINIGMMKKSKTDRREDFDNVYDFNEAFTEQFQITKPD